MKSPLILLFTRDGEFAQSVGEALFETGAIVLIARDVRDGFQLFANAAVSSIPLLWISMMVVAA